MAKAQKRARGKRASRRAFSRPTRKQRPAKVSRPKKPPSPPRGSGGGGGHGGDGSHPVLLSEVCKAHLAAEEVARTRTHQVRARYLGLVQEELAGVAVQDLTTDHVHRWLDKHQAWGAQTRYLAIAYLMAALNWAAAPEQRLIPSNPINGMRRPAIVPRGSSAVVSDQDHAKLMDEASPGLREMLFALQQTGCRPSSLCNVTAADCRFDLKAIVLQDHKTSYLTGRPLYVPISEALRPLLEMLCKAHPSGPIFRTPTGHPWRPTYVAKQLRDTAERLKKKGTPLQGKVFPYCYRHTLATKLLLGGMPDVHVAAILGHVGTRQLHHAYSHLQVGTSSLVEGLDRVLNRTEGTR